MTILFRYILREHLKTFTMCFTGLLTVYLVIDFFEKLRRFLRYDAELLTMLEYFLLRTPFISFQVAPFAVLMATLLTLGVLSRNNEITAMRSCGISLPRIAAPFVCFALGIALILLLFSAVVIPTANSQADYVLKTRIEKRSMALTFKADRPWVRAGNRTLMNVEVVEPDGHTLRGVHLYQLDAPFALSEVIEAKEARYGAEGWILISGIQRTLLANGSVTTQAFEQRPLDLSQTPEDFQNWLTGETEEMTLAELRAYIDRLQKDGYNPARFLTDYHSRIAFPFVSVVMTLVGIALSQRRSGLRGGGMAIGIGQALVLGFLYWTSHSVAIALGRTSVLWPVMAGWIANLLFLSLGLYLLLRVRH